MRIRVLHNGDDAHVVWQAPRRIENCRGFALYRRRNGQEEIVKTWVGFQGDSSSPGERRSSADWPVQKFMWTDYQVAPGDRVAYRVVPMVGPGKAALHAESGEASPWSEEVLVTAQCDGAYSAFFNRGIVASQWVSRRLGASPETAQQHELTRVISTPGDPLRAYLAGPLGERLFALLNAALIGGHHVYGALFELDDPQLLPLLVQFHERAHLVLANGAVKKKGEDENQSARVALTDARVEVHDRATAPRALAHNKFLVIADAGGTARAVWTGSTNWTKTGLCTQANNAVLAEDPALAAAYLHQWRRLRDAGSGTDEAFVRENSLAGEYPSNGLSTSLWFTPVAEEVDLAEARRLIQAATRGILFLMFNPGPRHSLLNAILDRRTDTVNGAPLYIHGVLNQDPGTPQHPVSLFHRGKQDKADFSVVLPAAVDRRLSYWVKEIRKYQRGWAMVHSKVIVLDPFGVHPVVMTGSHNLGPAASGKNDENLLLIRDAPRIAQAYAVNMISVYNQYRWRFMMQRARHATAWSGLQDGDRWQDGYFQGAKLREQEFWMGH